LRERAGERGPLQRDTNEEKALTRRFADLSRKRERLQRARG